MKFMIRISFVLVSCLLINSMQTYAQPIDSDSDGWINITSFNDLLWVSENPAQWSKSYELDTDIDASSTATMNVGDHDGDSSTPDEAMGWKPIGRDLNNDGDCNDSGEYFSGSFDGHGYTISGLNINRPTQSYVGFFGNIKAVSAVTISNLKIENISVSANEIAGGLIGNILASSANVTVEKCAVSGTINGDNRLGGLIGYVYTGASMATVKESYSDADLTGKNRIGGLIGYALSNIGKISISDSYSKGGVTGVNRLGGFIGYGYAGNIKISNCYTVGVVTGAGISVAAFIGEDYLSNIDITNSYWNNEISMQTTGIANVVPDPIGLVGLSDSEMKDQTKFANWDFINQWGRNDLLYDGYPYLKNIQSSSFVKHLNIAVKVAMMGQYNLGIHNQVPIKLELYQGEQGSSWGGMTKLKTIPAIININSWVFIEVDYMTDILATDKIYKIIVKAAGYLPLYCTEELKIVNERISYDFTSSASKAVGGENALQEVNGSYFMRVGDFNNDNMIDADDTQVLVPSYGIDFTPHIPH